MLGLAVPPYLLSRAIDDGLVGNDNSALFAWASILLLAGVLNAALAIARHRTMTKIRMDASFRTIRATVRQATRLGATLPRCVSSGEIAAIGMGDVQIIARSLTVTGPGVGGVVAYVTIAVILMSISPLLAVIVLTGVPVLALVVGPLLHRLLGIAIGYREQQGALTARLVDVVTGLRVLNGLGGKSVFASRHHQESEELRDKGYQVGAVTSWVTALAVGLPAFFLAVVTWLAARLTASGEITVGDLVAVYGYAAVLVVPVASFIEGGSEITRALVSAKRVTRFLSLEPRHSDPAAPLPAPPARSALYDPESELLIRPGELTALAVAQSSDTIRIIDRLGRFESSDATWDGIRLDAVPLHEVRERILVADHDADLFVGTVRDTIAGRHEPHDDAIHAALHTASASDIVEAMPDGLDSTLAARGSNVSGGQIQRLRMARALYASPEILFLVEPTSAVDAHTEATIASRLRAHRQGQTTVVATTSPLVLDQADTVVYLVEGRVSAVGTHQELLHTEASYRALVSREADQEALR